jgi:hypothetical protein
MGRWYRILVCVVIFHGIFMVLTPCPVQAQFTAKQQKIMDRLQVLYREMQQCGDDQKCIEEKKREAETLSRELAQSGSGAPGMPSQEEMQKHQGEVDAAKAQLAHRKGSPCYECEVGKAYVRDRGREPKYICVPTFFLVTWEYNEQRNRADPRIGPSSRAKFVIEERFQGCLKIVYKTSSKRHLERLELNGPYPLTPDKASQTITQVKNSFGLSQPSNSILGGDKFSTASTDKPDHFFLEPYGERDGLMFSCVVSPFFNGGKIHMPRMRIREELFVPNGWSLIEPDDWGTLVDVSLDKAFTCEEILAAVRAKTTLTRTLPYHYQWFEGDKKQGIDHIKDAKATVQIRFGSVEEPGLKVSPPDGLIASGPDRKGQYKPNHKTYTLTNTGKEQLRYNVKAGQGWVTLSRKSGVLAPKASTQVTVGVNASKTKGLKPDQRQDTVRFTNSTNGRGNTTRPVKLVNREKWRATWVGWDTLYFGDGTLAGGIKLYWEVRVDFVIEDGKYKQGQGTARFLKFEPHSHPPGIYDCEPLKGWAIDKDLKKHPSPYIKVRQFNVPGWCTSAAANLQLPKENYYLVDYYCVMDTDHAKVALGKKFGKIGAKQKVQQSSKYKSVEKNARLLPSAQQNIPLKDGWKKSYGYSKSMDAHFVEVKRIE